MAGRPRTETGADSPELRCRVPAGVRAALVALAKEQGRPLAAVVLDACRAYLRGWELPEEEKPPIHAEHA